jgi:hypothetical protein
MNDWSRSEVIALISLFIAIATLLAAVLVLPSFRRWIGLDKSVSERDVLIFAPKDGGKLLVLANETRPITRPIAGEVIGYKDKEIERLGLKVEILIKTDLWYPQATVPVDSDGKWMLNDARFGGTVNIIRATLKDKYSREHKSTEIEVTVV